MTTGDPIQRAGTGRQPAPMNAPPAQPLGIGVQPGTTNIIRARLVIVSGANGGVFVYSPTPGTGNLIASMAGAPGTDPYGNVFPAGVSSQIGGIEAILAGKQLGWDAPTDHPFALPSIFANPSAANGNQVSIGTGEGIVASNPAQITLYDSAIAATVPAIPAGGPGIFVPVNCPVVCDTWHNMGAMQNGWTIGGHATYRRTASGDLQVAFKDLVPGTTTNGTAIWSAANGLPAAYRPTNNHRVNCYNDANTSSALEFETDGSIQIFNVAGTTGRLDLYATIPITDPP